MENEFKDHMCATDDTLPNDSYPNEDTLQASVNSGKFEMHAFTKMTRFLVFFIVLLKTIENLGK